MKILNINILGIFSLFLFFILSEKTHAQQNNFNNLTISTGWNEIEGFHWDSTGQQYVWEKRGRVWVVDTNGVKLPNPLINITSEVGNWRDHGMNGMVLDPDFLNNGYIYLYYTVDRHYLMNVGTPAYSPTTNEFFEATIARVTRFTCDPATNFTTIIQGSRKVLIGETKQTGIPVLFESHSGGSLVFGTDGSLLVSTGDGGSYTFLDGGSGNTYWAQALNDSIIRPAENVGSFRSQIVNCLNGKILRIDKATGNGLPSNPYFDLQNPRSPESRVWALGLRNPFRVSLRPGTGETDITAGNPGTLYIGDVGWDQWEDMNVNDQPAQNFGWPLYEGLTIHPDYMALNVENMDEPNPLFGINGCTQQYFRFKDLLKQVTLNPSPFFGNPCDTLTALPASAKTYIHTRPIIDYKHGYQTRTGIFNGQNAAEINITDSLSPVQGVMFGGYSSIAGFFYNDNRFPPAWQNIYFHTDYVGEWIRGFVIDSANVPSQVLQFWDNLGAISYMAVNPNNGCIAYANYPDKIKEICYTGVINNPPVLVLSADTTYGTSPFQVQFSGSLSTDPENQPLSFKWKFGDGDSSSLANPVHNYIVPANQPALFYAKLKITDSVGQTATDSILISVNNTPPQVAITSFDDGDLYSMNSTTNLPLQALVTDAEHGAGELFYEWKTFLVHNSHTHMEGVDTNKISSTVISPIGCEVSNDYHFKISLTVTDAAGLSTTVISSIYPSCTPPVAEFMVSDSSICSGTTVQFTDLSTNFPATRMWLFPGGNPSVSTAQNPSVKYNNAGNRKVTLIVTGAMGTDTMIKSAFIHVDPLPAVTVAGSNGTLQFCPESTYSLIASSPSSIITWDWIRFNIPIGANSGTLPVVKGGTYKVTVTDTAGCTTTSAKYIVTKYAYATIAVTASGPLTFCPGDSVVFSAVTNYPANTFSWKNYSTVIPGATSSQYTATTSGSYKAIAKTVNNCVRVSPAFLVDVNCDFIEESRLNEALSDDIILFPNPVADVATLEFSIEMADNISILLTDITGRHIFLLENNRFESGHHSFTFETATLTPGIYQLGVIGNDKLKTINFIKTEGN